MSSSESVATMVVSINSPSVKESMVPAGVVNDGASGPCTVRLNVLSALAMPSVALITNVDLVFCATSDGVPLSTPFDVMYNPLGKDPACTVNAVAPVAVSVRVYATLSSIVPSDPAVVVQTIAIYHIYGNLQIKKGQIKTALDNKNFMKL
jgi:hypothetical protein